MARIACFLLLAVVAAAAAAASPADLSTLTQEEIDHLTIDHIEYREIPREEWETSDESAAGGIMHGPWSKDMYEALKTLDAPRPTLFGGDHDRVVNRDGVDIDKIVNIAKELWDFIKENQPVYDQKTDYGDAVPQGIKSWTELSGWHPMDYRQFEEKWVTKLKTVAFDIKYKVMWSWNGNYEGQGKFVSHAQIVPSDVHVAWGYKVTAVISVPEVLNIGKDKEHPVASVHVRLMYDLHTVVDHHHREIDYVANGDGTFIK